MAEIYTARIKEVIQRTHNVKSFRLELNPLKEFKAGQFLSVSLKEGDAWKRYLSISNSPTEQGYLEFTKKITQSDFSVTLDALKTGDTVTVQYPFGKFTLPQGPGRIAFLSGGIGITPIRSMCKYAVDKQTEHDIVLLYANRTPEDIAFKDDFDAMQQASSRIKVVHVLCEATNEFSCVSGRISGTVIQQQVPDYPERKFYLCGPPPMVEAMKKILGEELRVGEANIITENFQGY
jgi:ferredoxin-NADP reductase